MTVAIPIIVSILALFATFYQLHLQRVHNEKSVKPLPQIDLIDRKDQIAVHVHNNGLGPLIIDRLIFTNNRKSYYNIAECLDLDPKSYMHVSVTDAVKKVVLPDAHLVVFKKSTERLTDAEIDYIREQLTSITLKVIGRDIYDNKITLERDFQWFSRYDELKKLTHDCYN